MNIESLNLEITRRCTLNCEHCCRGEAQNKNIDENTLINIFGNVKKIDKLLITGGEPLIAINELEKMVELIKNNNIKINQITLVTNGTILSSRVLKILKELSEISNLNLEISYDIFHQLELDRKNLKNKRDNNTQIFKEMFNAKEYGKEKRDGFSYGIEPLGRAKNLTAERIKEIEFMMNRKIFIFPYVTWNKPICNLEDDTLFGEVCIDVNGNVVKYGLSFEDEDKYSNNSQTNINNYGFINAIHNFINKERSEDEIKITNKTK